MKLRFKENTLRLRLNQTEVQALASGKTLEEHVEFPGNTRLGYTLDTGSSAAVSFADAAIRVTLAGAETADWASAEDIGIYFDVPTANGALRVSIEKDLECLDGPPEEHDLDAYPRAGKNC